MASEIYEDRETFRGKASRSRLRTMYHDPYTVRNGMRRRREDGAPTVTAVGVVHTPYGTVEVTATIWWEGGQTIQLNTVRNGMLYRRWERRRRPLSKRGLTMLVRRWVQSLVAKDTEASDGE